jgi:hypothetical protein
MIFQVIGLLNYSKEPSREIGADLSKLKSKADKLVTELITGHCQLRKHLQLIDHYEGETSCRKCGMRDVTSSHILSDCEALAHIRLQLVGDYMLEHCHG